MPITKREEDMSKNTFNADAFLNQTVEAVMDTFRVPFPAGDHDDLQIKEVKINSGVNTKGQNVGKTWAQIELKLVSTDPNVRDEMKVEGDQDAAVFYREFLDLDDNGNLDVRSGKNIKLGKIRKAVGQNTEEAWSLINLRGAMIGARVKHKLNESGDAYAEVSAVYGEEVDAEDDE